jgi:hypothetical protein
MVQAALNTNSPRLAGSGLYFEEAGGPHLVWAFAVASPDSILVLLVSCLADTLLQLFILFWGVLGLLLNQEVLLAVGWASFHSAAVLQGCHHP